MFAQNEECNASNNLYCKVIYDYGYSQRMGTAYENKMRIEDLKKDPKYQYYIFNIDGKAFINHRYNYDNKFEFIAAYVDYKNIISDNGTNIFNIQSFYKLYEDKLKFYNEQLTKYHYIGEGDNGIIEYILIESFGFIEFFKFIAQFNNRFNIAINHILNPTGLEI